MSDERIITEAVKAYHVGHPITDLQARVIGSAWQCGQCTPLYTFASTGHTSSDLKREIAREITRLADDPASEELRALLAYVHRVGSRGPVASWSRLSW